MSTRQYARTLDPVPTEVSERSTSRSACRGGSWRCRPNGCGRSSAVRWASWTACGLHRRQGVQGTLHRDRVGIDTQGRKHVLGLREGATETAAVSKALLNDLVTRGLPTERAMLFLVDGAAALRRAISDVYGTLGVVQRCQLHKYRNVLGHLPGATARQRRAGPAHGMGPAVGGERETGLSSAWPLARGRASGAAASIREGLHETLTVLRPGLTGSLQRTLRTTNIIENLNSGVERYTRT